jgi:GlpG protein
MRMIGQLQDEDQARRFGRFLYGRGINNQVDESRTGGGWEIWVHDETRLDEALSHLQQFTQNPNDPIFTETTQVAVERRQRQEAQEAPKRARVIDARAAFYHRPIPYGILTVILIGISVIVFLLTKAGDDLRSAYPLFITTYLTNDRIVLWQSLPEVFHGQIWRLFTPMFVHFGLMHIFFNMWWLRDLGNIIEARRGKVQFLALVFVIAGISNVAQYVVGGPMFGGMSGVVYGLLCYMWMQGKFNPASDLSLNPQIVTFMIIWFFLCLFGIIPHVANTAHAAGAVVGAAWGYLGARWATRRW